MAGSEVLAELNGRLAMLGLVGVLDAVTRDDLTDQ